MLCLEMLSFGPTRKLSLVPRLTASLIAAADFSHSTYVDNRLPIDCRAPPPVEVRRGTGRRFPVTFLGDTRSSSIVRRRRSARLFLLALAGIHESRPRGTCSNSSSGMLWSDSVLMRGGGGGGRVAGWRCGESRWSQLVFWDGLDGSALDAILLLGHSRYFSVTCRRPPQA